MWALLDNGDVVDTFPTEQEAWAYAVEYRRHMAGYIEVVPCPADW